MSDATDTQAAPASDASPRVEPTPPADRRRPYRWLLLLPFVWQVALVPVVNDVRLAPFGVPFPMVWQMLGILLATGVLAIVYALDRARPDE